MPRPALLPALALASFLETNPSWQRNEGALVRTFELSSFPAAIAFVITIGFAAEAVDHHPDLDIRYKQVKVSLSTHDAGGITALDTALAGQIDALFAR